ncbi:VOC family protein [Paenibacillus sp. S33]
MKGFYSKLDYLIADDKDDNEFTVYMGYTQVVFKKADDRFLAQYGKPYYHIAINIPENTFAEVKKKISSQISLIKEDNEDEVFFDFWNSHSFYFEDPSGNIVEFIARHNMKNQTDYPFSMKDLIGVGEVGTVSKNVPNAVKKLNELGIPNFGESSENFAPIGDEHGLFIVVHKGREWFFFKRKRGRILSSRGMDRKHRTHHLHIRRRFRYS